MTARHAWHETAVTAACMHAPRPLAVSPVYCGRFRAIRLRWCLLPAALAAATVFVCVFSSLPRPVAHFLCIRQALHVVIDRLAKVHQRLVRNPEKVVHTHSVLWRCCSHGDCHRPSLVLVAPPRLASLSTLPGLLTLATSVSGQPPFPSGCALRRPPICPVSRTNLSICPVSRTNWGGLQLTFIFI